MATTTTQNPHAIEGRTNLLKKVLFAAALTLIIAICAPLTAWADEAKAIEVGNSITASQDNSFFKFKAPHDGRYAFVSNAIDGKANTLLRLYRDKLKANRIDYSYGDGTQNSRILRHLKKGEVVYLECSSSKKETTWRYPVQITDNDNDLTFARPYESWKNPSIEFGKDRLPVVRLCIKADSGEKHLLQGKDFTLTSIKLGSDGNWETPKANPSYVDGTNYIKLTGKGSYTGSIVIRLQYGKYYTGDENGNDVEHDEIYSYDKTYDPDSNDRVNTRSDVYSTTANSETIQSSGFLDNPLASVAAWIDGAWKSLTQGEDFTVSKDDITKDEETGWYQAVVRGINDWANELESTFTFKVCDHENVTKVDEKKPDCKTETDGNVAYWKCNDCGTIFLDKDLKNKVDFDADLVLDYGNAHKFGEWKVVEKATCGHWGEEQATCSICGHTTERWIDPTGEHSYGDWITDKASNGCQDGYKHRECKNCGSWDSESIKATEGHKWTDWSWENNEIPSCTNGAQKERTCTVCNEHEHEYVNALDHDWDEGETTVEASCGEKGSKILTCKTCGRTKVQSIPANNEHKWDDGKVTKEATCTEDGTRTFACSACGETRTESIKATGHDWGEWATTVNPGCETKGTEERACKNDASHKETRDVAATGHNMGDWKVVKAATSTEKGIEERTCTNKGCDHKESRDIAMLPSVAKPGTTTATSGATVTVASNTPTKTPSGATAAGNVTYKAPTNKTAASVAVPATVKIGQETYVVNRVDANAFKNNKKVKSVTLPATVTQVSANTFAGCTSLKSVNLGGTTTIGANAFKGAKSLTSVKTGANLKTIGSKAFSGTKVKTLTITSKKLSKKSVKGSLKGSSVKTVKVKVGNAKTNKSYVKKYKKYFTKGNAGKKVSVK